jgi:hypothetical protein
MNSVSTDCMMADRPQALLVVRDDRDAAEVAVPRMP